SRCTAPSPSLAPWPPWRRSWKPSSELRVSLAFRPNLEGRICRLLLIRRVCFSCDSHGEFITELQGGF
uniref:Uncharacterized protein n=1 Tax=Aegilops tauschii subsp. strangulata TaxID=200361 RepID=A0A453CD96_AEGTS